MVDLDVVVGRGTLLAGRYRLVQPTTSDLPGVHAWTAQDLILDRPVRAMLLDDGPVGAAQDAARRAALVADPRLVRVLDVGDHDGVPFIVTEPLLGRDLAELTATGPLPAQQARAVLGETAAALETARRRGVHHLALRPSAVRVTEDGRVFLSGLALDGELLGTARVPEEATSRADTVGLVSLLYLTLTGRWPAPAGAVPSSVARSPMVGGSPVPPAELSPGVPNDLDTLCAVTLGPHDDGPRTPQELVQELEPWAPIDVAGRRGTDIAAADAVPASRVTAHPGSPQAGGEAAEAPADDQAHARADADPDPESADRTPERTVRRSPVRTAAAGQAPPASPPGTPPPAIPPTSRLRDPRVPAPGGGGGGGGATAGSPAAGASSSPRSSPAPARPAASGAAASAGAGATTERRPGGAAPRGPGRTAPARRPVPAAPGATAVAASSAPRDAPPAPPAGSAPARPAPAARAPGGGASPRPADSFDSIIGRSADVLTRRQFDPTPVVLLVVALAVVVGVALAWRALTAPAPPIGGTDGFGVVTETEPPASAEPEEDPAPPPAEEQPAPEPEPEPEPVPPVIASAQMIDPPPGGDNNEHPEAVPLAIDGDPSTEWYSRTYVSPTYGMKPGIGYAVTLEQPATVSTVTLLVDGAGGNVEVRATDPATPTEGEVLASGPLQAETILTLAQPTEAQHIVLWFTELPQTSDGSNRVELAEVQVS